MTGPKKNASFGKNGARKGGIAVNQWLKLGKVEEQ